VLKIFLVRHGEVEGNSGPRPTFAGWADKPLTPRGVEQAEAVAARLASENIRLVWSSDLQRARITAETIAARHGLSVYTDAALREVSYGAWENLGHEEIHRDWAEHWARRLADPLGVAPPDGENYQTLWARLEPAWSAFLDEAETQASARPVAGTRNSTVPAAVLVAHNGPLRLLLCHMLGIPVSNYRRLKTSNCGLSTLEIETKNGKRAIVVACINETAHLRALDASASG
jgi:broad specificity phosphatase PhoE